MSHDPARSAVRSVDGGVLVAVRVTTRAAADAIRGVESDERGQALLVRVTAAPTDGRANRAVLSLLADAWDMPKSAFSVARGHKDRRKVIHVAGDPKRLAPSIAAWLAEQVET